MSEHNKHFEQEELENRLSVEFQKDLGQLFGPGRKIPPEVDASILYKTGKHFSKVHRRRIVRWISSSAAAAVLLFVVLLNVPHRSSYQPSVKMSRVAAEDIDRSGRIDILDAFELAKDIKSGRKVSESYDFNTDGMVDERDVDWLARAAVRLNGGTEL
jgi:hypothetical protein